MKNKKKLRKLERLVDASRADLERALKLARKATERAEQASIAADGARDDFKRVERLLRKEIARAAALKNVKKKKAAKKARNKVSKRAK